MSRFREFSFTDTSARVSSKGQRVPLASILARIRLRISPGADRKRRVGREEAFECPGLVIDSRRGPFGPRISGRFSLASGRDVESHGCIDALTAQRHIPSFSFSAVSFFFFFFFFFFSYMDGIVDKSFESTRPCFRAISSIQGEPPRGLSETLMGTWTADARCEDPPQLAVPESCGGDKTHLSVSAFF